MVLLNTIHEGHWGLAIHNRREQFVDELPNWATQADNNELRMAIMPRFQTIIVFETVISKAYKGGMKYAAPTDPNNPSDPQCEIAWRGRMTRLLRQYLCESLLRILRRVRLMRQQNYRCHLLFPVDFVPKC